MTAKYYRYNDEYKLIPIYNDDVVEIVRCKDCKHFNTGWCMNEDIREMCCGDDATFFYTDPDFFCKFGERKETDE